MTTFDLLPYFGVGGFLVACGVGSYAAIAAAISAFRSAGG